MRFQPLLRIPALATTILISLISFAACSSSEEQAADGPGTPNTTGGMAVDEADAGADGSTAPGTDAGGSKDSGGDGGSGMTDMSAAQKRIAEMLTTFWENDTTVFQYAFSRNNMDGYGYTSGRVGFTTATSDAFQIVKCFDAAFGPSNNLMKKYEPPLASLDAKKMMTGQIQPDITGLDAVGNFPNDWKATANSATTGPKFAACQDQRVDQSYWTPAIAVVKKWGLTTALTKASIYDATIVHGATNVANLVKMANDDTGNTTQKVPTAPLSRAAESAWLAAFLDHRTALINSSTAWRGAIARGANYEQQRRDGNFDFAQNIITSATASGVYPGKGYPTNGYQACVLHPDATVTGVAQCTAPVSN